MTNHLQTAYALEPYIRQKIRQAPDKHNLHPRNPRFQVCKRNAYLAVYVVCGILQRVWVDSKDDETGAGLG
jgi:hypothetical protein